MTDWIKCPFCSNFIAHKEQDNGTGEILYSSFDWIKCPLCGSVAHTERDTKTGEILSECSRCNWYGQSASRMRMMNVNLLVSEYEWTCPICNRLNKEIEVTEVVVCGNCKTALAVNP